LLDPLTRKLEQFVRLSVTDRHVLGLAASHRIRKFAARTDIIREGEQPRDVHFILSGWACRYKQLEDGRRQVVALFLPGDICDLNVFILQQMDHSIGTITAVTIADLSREFLEQIRTGYPRVATALWWETLVSVSIQREWTLNLGQRTASERVAHLLCELFFRLRVAGLTQDANCDFPLTQADLADATGLSKVHVNRTLQELRADKLIVLRERTLSILDFERLASVGLFNAHYLHLEHEGHQFDAND